MEAIRGAGSKMPAENVSYGLLLITLFRNAT